MDPSQRPAPISGSGQAPVPQPINLNQPTPIPAASASFADSQISASAQHRTSTPPSGVNQPERLAPIAEVRPFEEPEHQGLLPRIPSQYNRESTLRRASPSSIEKISYDNDPPSGPHDFHHSPTQGLGLGKSLPSPLAPGRVYDPTLQRVRTIDRRFSANGGPHTEIDHIVPVATVSTTRTVYDRIQPTLDSATEEMKKYERKAKYTGWALNAAIGLQVLLGSLTTGLSAVATSGRSAAVNTTILGALSTIVASYLARARGSNEPELSITRTKDLEQFIREVRAFQLDRGHETSLEWDAEVDRLRRRFEDLLGNANGERRLSPPV